MKYELIEEYYLSNFIEVVNTYLKNGWKFHGSTYSTLALNGDAIYYQAMIKEEENDNN